MSAQMNARIAEVTDRIVARSAASRAAYLARMDAGRRSAGRIAPISAAPTSRMAMPPAIRPTRPSSRTGQKPNIAIVSAYNDMLSGASAAGALPPV
ncbi:MAG: hypothetical protein WDN69_10965 [Aliidongia sp.]